jgi:hypothetical protein
MNTELNAFVRDALQRGIERPRIRELLLAAHWRPEEVDAALAAWADGEPGLPVPRRNVPMDAREAFMHMVMFATLYIFTYNVGAILFVLIERWLPDVTRSWGQGDFQFLRWALAGALIALPIFVGTTAIVERSLAREPEKRISDVRRKLTYLTLLVAALILIGNFIVVVSSALGGELTSRFVLKTLVVFAITGVVFGYYLNGLRREESETDVRPRRPSWLGRAGLAASVVTIVAGFLTAGAPERSRTRELDDKRVYALIEVEHAVSRYHASVGSMPASVADLVQRAGLSDVTARDPVSQSYYLYERRDSTGYAISADFAAADTLTAEGRPVERRWRHAAGRVWFERRWEPGLATR